MLHALPFVKEVLVELQLRNQRRHRRCFATNEQLHVAELLVGDAENAHLAKLGQVRFYALDVHLGILATRTMPHVDGELELRESIGQQPFAEERVGLAVALGLRWQVEQH